MRPFHLAHPEIISVSEAAEFRRSTYTLLPLYVGEMASSLDIRQCHGAQRPVGRPKHTNGAATVNQWKGRLINDIALQHEGRWMYPGGRIQRLQPDRLRAGGGCMSRVGAHGRQRGSEDECS